MNARAHSIDLRDNPDLIAARRLLAAALLAFLLLNATLALARADSNNPFPGTQNDFTNQCRSLGGTPHREATHVVSCTWPNGGKQTCDFNQKPNSCTYTPPPKNSPSPNGSVTTGNIVQADQNHTSATDAAQSGGVLAADGQIEAADSSDPDVPLVEEEQSVDVNAPTQTEPSDIGDLPVIEGEDN